MNRFYRFSGVFFWLVSFFVRGWYIKCCTKDPVKLRNRLARNTSFISRKLLKCFRISVKVINPEKLQILDRENHLIVSNHVSYTDILVLSACYPFIFITSLEMAANPVLGDITKMGGSLFTNRKQYTSLPQEINNFANALMTGFNIVLFPEGTSTNGETIREFRKSLFQTSITAQKPILPICVRYTSINGRPFALQQDRDKVCWYGDMPFIPHFWEILRHNFTAEVRVLDTIPYDPKVNRQQLCDIVHSRLLQTFNSTDLPG